MKSSQKTMEFLDVLIFKGPDGYIQTDMFQKSFRSSHPAPTENNIPTGQFLRARRICSRDDLFHKQARDLNKRFRDRGNKTRTIQEGSKRSCTKRRDDLFTPKQKSPKEQHPLRFITTFNGHWQDIRAPCRNIGISYRLILLSVKLYQQNPWLPIVDQKT